MGKPSKLTLWKSILDLTWRVLICILTLAILVSSIVSLRRDLTVTNNYFIDVAHFGIIGNIPAPEYYEQ